MTAAQLREILTVCRQFKVARLKTAEVEVVLNPEVSFNGVPGAVPDLTPEQALFGSADAAVAPEPQE